MDFKQLTTAATSKHYTIPSIFLDNLPRLFCFVCKSDNIVTQTASGIVNLTVIMMVLFVALKLSALVYDVMKYYIYVQYIDSGVRRCKRVYGDHWVVITGGSDGIGLAFARKFARKQFKLIIISRNLEKLQKTQELLRELGSPQVDIIQADFSVQDEQMYDRVRRELALEERSIGILVNNVGTTTSMRSFHKHSFDSMRRVMNVNSLAATFMCQAVLEQMHRRKLGLIVNISSIGTVPQLPLMGAYVPSKVYLNKLSRTLAVEYPHLTFVSLQTGLVKTKLLGKEFRSAMLRHLMITSIDSYVDSAFRIVCSASTSPGLVVTTGHLRHQLNYISGMLSNLFNLNPVYLFLMGVYSRRKSRRGPSSSEKSQSQSIKGAS